MIEKEIEWVKKLLRVCVNIEDYTLEERKVVFGDLNNEYSCFSLDQCENVKQVFESQMKDEDLLYVLSILVQNGGADRWLLYVIHVADKMKFDIYQRSMLELQLKIIEEVSDRRPLLKYHKTNMDLWGKELALHNMYQPMERRNEKRIVIVTEQLLRYEQHAPTKVILDMAYLLQKKMGYSILIMTFPSKISNLFLPWYNPQMMLALEDYNHVPICREYKGETFYGYQTSMENMNIRDYSLALSYILEWNPLFVYSFGVVNPIVDVLARYTTVVAQSMSTYLPISEAQILIGLEDDTSFDLAENQKLVRFKKNPLYFGEEQKVHTREEYGIKKEQFLCVVVGNRLETEVNDEFLQMLQDICKENLSVAILFIGKIEDKKEIQDKLPNNQIYFLEYCFDLLGIYKIMDLYVNPRRQGGGYSAAMAIAAGLPVVTCDYGDVAYHAGSDFLVSDYNEMQQEILHYVEDSAYRELKQKQVDKRAETMTEDNMYRVMEDNMNKLIKEINEYV